MRTYIPKDEYDIGKERMRELHSITKQYAKNKRKYLECMNATPQSPNLSLPTCPRMTNAVEKAVERAEYYAKKTEIVEQAAIAADADLYQYIIICVTEKDMSYEKICARYGLLPKGRNTFYASCRRFYYELDKMEKKAFGGEAFGL